MWTDTLKKFYLKHRKFTITILLFACVNSCFHGGSKVNQNNLSELFGFEFPPCRAAKEFGDFNDMDWKAEGKLIFKSKPTEEFYLLLDEKPQKNGHKYKLSISAPDISPKAKKILGNNGFLFLTITKGDSIATYTYGSY